MKHWKKKESFNQQPKEKRENPKTKGEDEASKESAAATELKKHERKKENQGAQNKKRTKFPMKVKGKNRERGCFLGMRGPGVPGRGSEACDPNSQNRPPFSLLPVYLFIYLFIIFLPKIFK